MPDESLRKTKMDQESKGRVVLIPVVAGNLCPVGALDTWLHVSGIREGVLFRRLTKSGNVLANGLSGSALANIVKQRAAKIGLDPMGFSGHSLRAGFATSAAVVGLPVWRIKRQTGHVSDAVLERYIRAAGFGLSPLAARSSDLSGQDWRVAGIKSGSGFSL